MNALLIKTRPAAGLLSIDVLVGFTCSKRAYEVTHYVTKKKRIQKNIESATNMCWTKDLFKRFKEINENDSGEPHMFHVVTLRKSTFGHPWWEKEIIAELKLDGKLDQSVIHKNIPGVNKMLNEVKHLVQVQPLKFPYGLPQHPSEFENVVLKSNGELIFMKRLDVKQEAETAQKEQSYEDQSAATEKESGALDPKWKLTKETVQKGLNRTLQLYQFNYEQFPTKYEYKMNQDGKLHRYNFNNNVRKYKW